MTTHDISNLKINKLTRAQYVEAKKNGQITEATEAEQIYLVPPSDGKFASGVSTTKYEGEGEDINTIPQFRNSIVTSTVPSTDDLDSLAIGDMIYVEGESSGGSGSGTGYILPAAGSALGGVKSGGDVTISNGVITVNDDSHNHTNYAKCNNNGVISGSGLCVDNNVSADSVTTISLQLADGEYNRSISNVAYNGDVLDFGDDNTVASANWVRQHFATKETCLIEGTPINMYDGTYKNIEEVKTGDLVLSYNPVTKEQVPAVVIKRLYTGAERNYTVYSFENGKALTVFNGHMIYNQQTGNVEEIRIIKELTEVVTSSGEVTHWTVSSPITFAGRKKDRYNLITSNNLYFANDILLGSKGYTKLDVCLDYKIELPEKVMKTWEQDAEDYNDYASNILTNPEFHMETASARKAFRQASAVISSNKQKLTQTDYKTQKYVEGKLTEADWDKSNQQREEYRLIINENEQLLKDSNQELDEIWAKYRKHKTPKDIFSDCCIRDNEIFELVKAYFEEQKQK